MVLVYQRCLPRALGIASVVRLSAMARSVQPAVRSLTIRWRMSSVRVTGRGQVSKRARSVVSTSSNDGGDTLGGQPAASSVGQQRLV